MWLALFLSDGKLALACGDDEMIVLRSLSDGRVIHVFSAKDHGGANKLASLDGNIAISVHQNGMVVAWDIGRCAVLHVMGQHTWPIPPSRSRRTGNAQSAVVLMVA